MRASDVHQELRPYAAWLGDPHPAQPPAAVLQVGLGRLHRRVTVEPAELHADALPERDAAFAAGRGDLDPLHNPAQPLAPRLVGPLLL
jgi:hypothetical protein